LDSGGMKQRKSHGYPVLILGAGRGGSALLEMFLSDDLVKVVAICDIDPEAAGLKLAHRHHVPVFTSAAAALQACAVYPDCIVYNLTHDDAIATEIAARFGNRNVTSGVAAKLIWQMVTNLKRIRGELETSQSQLKAIISHAMDGIITTGESGEIEGFNPAAEHIFGYLQEEVLGCNIDKLLPDDHRDTGGETPAAGGSVLGRFSGVRSRETSALRKNGERFPLELSVSEMELSGRRYFVGIVRDISERKRAEAKIAHMAHHDYLTNLPNRALFLDRLNQAVALARRGGHRLAVLFLDLDGFKTVNDTCGHEAGDLLLQGVAERLTHAVRDSDTAARLGGDEFTFVLHDIGDAAAAAAVAQKIITALAQPFVIGDASCQIGGSIGIAIFPDDGADGETLLKLADEAMYAAKQEGRGRFRQHRDLASRPALSSPAGDALSA
jgi:diguanylate cyclase (GGDEF)-like protein/PAS domain S-box-containing protein